MAKCWWSVAKPTTRPGVLISSAAELYDPALDMWSDAGTLTDARRRHTAILLPAGTVLVCGGLGDGGTLKSAEIYDPETNAWTLAASLAVARQDFTLTGLPDGKLLAAGGDSQLTPTGTITALNSCEIYDPQANGWVTGPVLSKEHLYHTATQLQNGEVLIASGDLTLTATTETTTPVAELFDQPSNDWSAAGSLAKGRARAAAGLLPFNRVVVAGGFDGTNILATAEHYDFITNIWTATGALGQAREQHTGTVLTSGKVVVIGGFDGSLALTSAEMYDPDSGTWSPAGDLSVARKLHTATLLQNGDVLVVGGIDQLELSSVELYDAGSSASTPLTLGSAPTASPNPLLSVRR